MKPTKKTDVIFTIIIAIVILIVISIAFSGCKKDSQACTECEKWTNSITLSTVNNCGTVDEIGQYEKIMSDNGWKCTRK